MAPCGRAGEYLDIPEINDSEILGEVDTTIHRGRACSLANRGDPDRQQKVQDFTPYVEVEEGDCCHPENANLRTFTVRSCDRLFLR